MINLNHLPNCSDSCKHPVPTWKIQTRSYTKQTKPLEALYQTCSVPLLSPMPAFLGTQKNPIYPVIATAFNIDKLVLCIPLVKNELKPWNKVSEYSFNASVKSLCEKFLIIGCWRRRKPIFKAYYDSCIIYHPTLQQQGWARPSLWVLVTPWPCKRARTSQFHPSTITMGFLRNTYVYFFFICQQLFQTS